MDFTTPASMTPRVAAHLILTQATQLCYALEQLSTLSTQKYLVYRAATDAEEQSAFDAVMARIAAVASGLAN